MSEGSFVLGHLGSFGLGATAGVLAVLATAALVVGSSPSHGNGAVSAVPSADFVRRHGMPAERNLQDAIAASMLIVGRGGTGTSAAENPVQQDAAGLLARAEDHRRKREFEQACELYAVLARRGAMTADSWADYADAQASLSGRIAGEPARAIAAALALEPRHAKALWLQASLAHEIGRYEDALDTWRSLLEIVPADSSDARIVESNIAEATRLASN